MLDLPFVRLFMIPFDRVIGLGSDSVGRFSVISSFNFMKMSDLLER
jgi:hypothetical protein